jgi:hypothetical protein
MGCHVALVRVDILEEYIASMISAERIRELWTSDISGVVPSSLILWNIMTELRTPKMYILVVATRRHIPEDKTNKLRGP